MKLLKYIILWTPTFAVACIVMIIWCSHWVSGLLEHPERFLDSPRVIQQLTRAVYSHTRTIWQSQEDCVQFDPVTLYVPRLGECRFSNVEFATRMNFVEPGVRFSSQVSWTDGTGQSGKPRVLVMGDSYAMGWGVEDGETFASVLAAEYGFPTINLSVSSFGTARELLHLHKLALLTPGDVLVIQYFDNDFRENVEFVARGKLGPYEERDFARLVAYEAASQDTLAIAGLALRLSLVDAATWIRSLLGGSGDQADNVGRMTPEDAFLRVYDRFPAIHGHPIILMPVSAVGTQRQHFMDHRELDRRNIRLLELRLSASEYFNIDLHFNAKGHAAIAKLLAEVIPTVANEGAIARQK